MIVTGFYSADRIDEGERQTTTRYLVTDNEDDIRLSSEHFPRKLMSETSFGSLTVIGLARAWRRGEDGVSIFHFRVFRGKSLSFHTFPFTLHRLKKHLAHVV